ncbi:LysE/ArgO family amino acid transporter [Pectinatus frisingensis]|uniref:LysE/ArgO family amino acid transporter n=1 Tax=Pectinatus frisingensis TaxID=865 RepID=UPI0018C66F11|nr:LysE family transporter [Pectinatus frisingensis]
MSYFLQGLIIGIAYTAPIGMQNMFVINSALTYKRRQSIFISFAIIFFDITLSLSCFFGIGTLIEYSPALKLFLLLGGSIFLLYIGINLISASPDISCKKTDISIYKVIYSAFIVTWFNPQAILDGTIMLGSFHAIFIGSQALYFIFGILTASCLWFTGLTLFITQFRQILHENTFSKINTCCGIVIILYGIKLFGEAKNLLPFY